MSKFTLVQSQCCLAQCKFLQETKALAAISDKKGSKMKWENELLNQAEMMGHGNGESLREMTEVSCHWALGRALLRHRPCLIGHKMKFENPPSFCSPSLLHSLCFLAPKVLILLSVWY